MQCVNGNCKTNRWV